MAKKKKQRGETREAPPEDIEQGPLCHEQRLTPLLEELARAVFSQVGHFFYPTFEQWKLGFLGDMHPWREIVIWESIARTLDLYLAKHPDANAKQVVGTIVSISTGQFSRNKTKAEKELRTLFLDAYKKQWVAPPGEPFEFPQNRAIVLPYEDIIDEWNGVIHPNLRRQVDPRRILSHADIIVAMASKSEEQFCLYGRERLQAGQIPEGLRALVVCLDLENEKSHELEKLCYVVQAIKGRHDCG